MKNIQDYFNKSEINKLELTEEQVDKLIQIFSSGCANMLFDLRDEIDTKIFRPKAFWIINTMLQKQVDSLEKEAKRLKIEINMLSSTTKGAQG